MNQKIRTTLKAGAGLGLALATALSVSACSATNAATPTSTASGGSTLPTAVPVNCKVDAPVITASTPTVAVLGATGPGISYYTPDLATVLDSASKTKARVLVNGIGNPTAAPDKTADYVLTGDGPNQAFRSRNLTCKTALIATAVTQTLAKVPAVTHPDVFNGLITLSGNLKGNPSTQPVDVVLFASLSAQGGGVDLSNPATLAHPDETINKLAAEGLIPSCKNERFYGVGADRGLSDIHAAQLQTFWRKYTAKCGGELVTWTEHLTQFPVTSALAEPDTSQSTIPIVVTTEAITATLPDVLFDPGSPDLRPSVADQLDKLLNQVATHSGKIDIFGYTDVGGDLAANKQLGSARSVSIKTWLVAHGVDAGRISTQGIGSADPVYAAPTTSAEHQANRRVVVIVHTIVTHTATAK